ncbi:hypothetical protein [Pontibacter oryzae]|uniref:Uncharacterized protein n=1 Tax=Pontibacter oryzae TaxID=2304593 RepID=A0A399SKK9_9BACT|nr:hypothetical protein [Pontibacter oryzae]RIJ42467.1 hypothetical protein D1627_00940 [Pontibacter oryzae]
MATIPLTSKTENKSEINIDIHQQHVVKTKYKKLYFAISVALILAYIALLIYDFEWSSVLMFIVLSINNYQLLMYIFGKDPFNLHGKSYLKFNNQGFIYKPLRKAPREILWQDVSGITLHLFEAEFHLTNGGTSAINLEDLSDDNLKLVKEWLVWKKLEIGN